MKTRPLPETDLARIAPLPADLKRAQLEHLRLGRPPYRYAPVRKSFADLLNVHSGLFGELPRTPFNLIADVIRSCSRSDDEEIANLRVAEALYNYTVEQKISGRKHEFFPMALGIGEKVVFWHSLVLALNSRPLVPFIDPRRQQTKLTKAARRFVFSMMYERIRVANPDFAHVTLGILQFTTPDTGPRKPILYTDDGVELFSYDQLEDMVRETYAIWHEVCAERVAEARKRAAGGSGDRLI
ncbi:type VI toxin-antitoxin system SocB family DNA replication inhibitor toxin [Rhodoplanes sp. SY1]|uniref:type VI toxin-antitoxin system SocB family DNA replication inhibitor toxin n=1 Tax=Rhodoplanes sp. SY1 TaxID=3166646 RepID=UPI0038B503BF